MTIKKKLTIGTMFFMTIIVGLGLSIYCGYNYVAAKATLANDFDKQVMYLHMMLRGLNEAIINDGTPSTLRSEKEGLAGFDYIHTRLLTSVKDPHMRRIMKEDIDPLWERIKEDSQPFLAHYIDLNDHELMVTAGKIIIKTEKIINHVRDLSESTRAVVDKNSKISANIVIAIEYISIPLLIFSGIFAFHMYRAITRPIGELTAVAEGLNRGDLGVVMDESSSDEFGALAGFFNKSTAKLNQTTQHLQKEVAERKKAEDQLHDQLERIKILHTFEKTINSTVDINELLTLLVNEIILHVGVNSSSIHLFNAQTQTLEYTFSRGFHTDALKYTKLKLGESNAGIAARDKKVVYIADLMQSPQGFLHSPDFGKEGFISYFAVPLIAKGKVKGVIELFYRTHVKAEDEWIDFMETISSQAALAIEKTELLNDLKKAKNDLLFAYDETIAGWSHAMDLRDEETEGHSKRVTDMTVQIAVEFGIKNEELLHIKRGALLHDIGKMGVPDNILLKPGKLTDEEWVMMKRHPEYAYNMLSRIHYLETAIEIPYGHHEKWDGTGYPRGIKGEEIPLSARIFAVVDVWDALRSDRPYRAAWPKEKVIEHIQSLRGTHFDPDVLEVFFEFVLKEHLDETVRL